jgi:hypothetical protein
MEWKVDDVVMPAKQIQTVEVQVDEGLKKGKDGAENEGDATS